MAKCLLCKREIDDCVEIPISDTFSMFFCDECLSYIEKGGEITKLFSLETSFGEELQKAIDAWMEYKSQKEQIYSEGGKAQLFGKIRNQVKATSEEAVTKKILMSIDRGYRGICFDLGTIPEEDIKKWFKSTFALSPKKDAEGKAYREFKMLFAKMDDPDIAKNRAYTIYFNFKKYVEALTDEKYCKTFANWLRDDVPSDWGE